MPLKSAAELGLTEDQRCALVKTLIALEDGRLKEEHSIHFDMATWHSPDVRHDYHCGSVCCIGGTAELLGGVSLKRCTVELHSLFVPDTRIKDNPYEATTKQAAVALRHYLTTGKENWKAAMETPR